MRQLASGERVERFLEELGRRATSAVRIYLTGGATAVLRGWRATTIDIDLKLVPDSDELLREIPRLKETLQINVELASPDQFIPELPGWQDRSLFVRQIGKLSVYHFDLYSQALAKIERGHTKDLADVRSMFEDGLLEPDRLRGLFGQIEPLLFRYPALDPPRFRRAVEGFLGWAAETN
jgi:hypothetical protein